MNRPKPYEIYRHFKGNLYQIISIAEHSENGEELVIYQALYGDYRIYARPITMFGEKVDQIKYPQSGQQQRFALVDRTTMSQTQDVGKTSVFEASVREQKGEKGAETGAVTSNENIQEENTGFNLDPLVLEFLDANTYEEKLNILTALHYRITKDMINVMAMASDIEINDNEVEEQYTAFKNCLMKLQKFEGSRLR